MTDRPLTPSAQLSKNTQKTVLSHHGAFQSDK